MRDLAAPHGPRRLGSPLAAPRGDAPAANGEAVSAVSLASISSVGAGQADGRGHTFVLLPFFPWAFSQVASATLCSVCRVPVPVRTASAAPEARRPLTKWPEPLWAQLRGNSSVWMTFEEFTSAFSALPFQKKVSFPIEVAEILRL